MRGLFGRFGMSIPDSIGVASAVQRQGYYAGQMTAARFPGIAAAGIDWIEMPSVALQFARAGRSAQVACSINGSLSLVCARCQVRYPRQVAIDALWTLVATDAEEAAVLDTAEPVRVVDDLLAVDAAVEQEVLLDLPVLARCGDCIAKVEQRQQVDAPPETTHRPFAGLRLK